MNEQLLVERSKWMVVSILHSLVLGRWCLTQNPVLLPPQGSLVALLTLPVRAVLQENFPAWGGGPRKPPACLVAALEGARPSIFWMFCKNNKEQVGQGTAREIKRKKFCSQNSWVWKEPLDIIQSNPPSQGRVTWIK